MNLRRFRLLTFDATNTLIQTKVPPGKQYGEIGAKHGIVCDSEQLIDNFKTHWSKMNKEHPNFGYQTGLGWGNWWKQIIIRTFKDCDNWNNKMDEKKLENLATRLIEAYKTDACWQHCTGVVNLLSFLKEKDITLGVISNFDPRLNIILENVKLRHYFKFVATSYEVGVEKPDSKIFQKAIKMSKIKDLVPQECLHIGDNFNLDYNGAKAAGWQGALISYQNDLTPNVNHSKTSDFIFSSLFDLHKSLRKEELNAQPIF